MVKSEIRALLTRHMHAIREVFAEPLAARCGRSVEEVRSRGLRAHDFRSNEGIELTLPDGSTMALRYAFFVHDEAQGVIGVFTEHCGYHCFPANNLELRELRDGAVIGKHRW
jgi:hypothetical protein